MRMDERVPRLVSGSLAAALLFTYAATSWHTTSAGLLTILVAEMIVLGTGEYVSFRLRRR